MSKRLANEKEIENSRIKNHWRTVITLVSAFNVKNAGGAMNSEEVGLYCCFYLGEAELEKVIEEKLEDSSFIDLKIPKDELKQAYSYLSAAVTTSRKSKDKYCHLLQDSLLLIAKYHYVVGEYETCIESVNSVDLINIENLQKRSKCILSEVLTCKALSLEHLNTGTDLEKDIILSFEKAGEVAVSICVEEERGIWKRNVTQSTNSYTQLSKLMEISLLIPGKLLVENGLVEDAIHNYRSLLKILETKATHDVRKKICRSLAQVLLSCTCSALYSPPTFSTTSDSVSWSGSISISTPRKESSDAYASSSSSGKLPKSAYSLPESVFCPRDEIEEALLVLLLAEAMHLQHNDVTQTIAEEMSKRKVLNEANAIYDLLILVLTRRDQYNVLANSLEKSMKLAYEEFHLWYSFGLSLACAGKYSRALLVFQQCHKLQPGNAEVLMFCMKLCINHLHEFETAIEYGKKILDASSDSYVKANARCAIGVCYNQMAVNAKSFEESQLLLKSAAEALEKAREIDSTDNEILFNLAWNQAMSKQLSKSTATLKECLMLNPNDLNTLHLFSLVLSAQKKNKEALEVLEAAIAEHPTDFNLLFTKVKLTDMCHGSQAALGVCHSALILWNNLYNEKQLLLEPDTTHEESFSPSFSTTKRSMNETKILDATASLRKVTLADAGSVDGDGTGSIAASVRIERALSEAPSGTIGRHTELGIPRSIGLLAKLWLVTAECFIHLEDVTEAGSCIVEAASIFPLSPDLLYMKGRLNELQGNHTEAKACYESALSVNTSHKSARQRLSLLYNDQGDLALAEKILRSCILLDAGNHTAWNDLGLVLESDERYEEASECFLTSLKLEYTAPIVSYTSISRAFKAFDT